MAASETEIRIVDLSGGLLSSYFVDKNNGTITDIYVDGEHLFIITSNKQLVLFDVLQQKKIGNYFNDFTQFAKDKLPEEKSLTCVTTGNDGLFVAVGGSSGSLYIIRSWVCCRREDRKINIIEIMCILYIYAILYASWMDVGRLVSAFVSI